MLYTLLYEWDRDNHIVYVIDWQREEQPDFDMVGGDNEYFPLTPDAKELIERCKIGFEIDRDEWLYLNPVNRVDVFEARKMLSTKKLASYSSYDPNDCTTVGEDYTLYSDGRVAIETRSCWQGSRSNVRYTTDPGAVDIDDPGPEGSDDDLEARLVAFADELAEHALQHPDGIFGVPGLRKTRGGHIVW